MHNNDGLRLPAPAIQPALDPHFRPAVLANHAFRAAVASSGHPVDIVIALEQTDGSVFHYHTEIFPESHPDSVGNFIYLERLVKFLLWAWGGWRIHFVGPKELAEKLQVHFQETDTGRFDSDLIGVKVYDHPLEVIATRPESLPPANAKTQPLGRHLDGCRIGFDLGGSDRKVAAVMDGKVVFSEEIVWDPYHQPDPQYHIDGIQDTLKKAAAHLPRVDAIGGSSAGVYVNNRVKVASLFRGVSPEQFNARVKDLFIDLQKEWNIPFDVVNDGEVTALAGSMSLNKNAVLGIAMGTSEAVGYVTPEGNITTWLNELAFAPVDYCPTAACDEWSGDYGVGAQYFSQQAIGRLLPASGLPVEATLGLPEKLKAVQKFMEAGDERAAKIYQTIGTCLGYALAHYADFYDFENVLILGRVTSGKGGDLILQNAQEVLRQEFPELAASIAFHIPDEKDKRHGQAVAAASLPRL